ncbi:MAG: hypothetical protein H7096_02420 [Flavobacterium sp.]|nr:hypothetical protein [Pedobacter sp.]
MKTSIINTNQHEITLIFNGLEPIKNMNLKSGPFDEDDEELELPFEENMESLENTYPDDDEDDF